VSDNDTELWSTIIGDLHGWKLVGGDLRWCPDGAEHEMAAPTSMGDLVCERCGAAVVTHNGRTRVIQAYVYRHAWWRPRPCGKCGQVFEPRKFGYRLCPGCYEFVPPPTGRQSAYILVLARLLGIDPPACESSSEAVNTIDELMVLIEADPDVVNCAAPDCNHLVNVQRTRLCIRHRKADKRTP
jgi:hypothetical protein